MSRSQGWKAVPYAVVIAAALYFLFLSTKFESAVSGTRLGPEAWPMMVLLVLLVACIAGVVQVLHSSDLTQGFEDTLANPSVTLDEQVENTDSYARLFGGVFAMVAFVVSIDFVGFTVATFFLLLAIAIISGFRRTGPAILIAGIGALGFFVVFQKIVYVSLPIGIGPFAQFTTSLLNLLGVR